MTVEQYTSEIETICQDLLAAAEAIAKLDSVTHLSKSRIQWHGGIVGAIKEYRTAKRFEKLVNAEIYKGLSFWSFASYITENAQELVKKQLEVQKLTTPEDFVYFGNAKLIVASINTISEVWFNYSPDMAREPIQDNVTLLTVVQQLTKEEIAKMDLPPDLQSYKQEPKKGGCFNSLLLFLFMSSALMGLPCLAVKLIL